MFKVLVISYYFPPMGLSGVQRVLKFVKYMRGNNWEPTVITTGSTGYFAHDPVLFKEAEKLNLRVIRTEAFDPLSIMAKYKTIRMPREFIRKFLSRVSKTFFIPDNKIHWSNKAYKVASDLMSKEKFDIIFVSIPPFSTFSIAAKLSQKFDVSLFVDYRDLWTNNQFAFNPTPYHTYKHKKLEYKALKVADKIIAVNRRIKESLLSTFKFLTFEDVVIIPHGYDLEDIETAVVEPKLNSKMRLTYSGMFYEFITPKYFLQAFKQLTIERPDIAENIELHFIGYLRKENQKLVKKLGLIPYVKDHGYLDHSSTITKLLSSDVLWFMLGKSKSADSVSPGKMFEYFGTKKPILACVPEGIAKVASQEYGASYVTEPDNVEEIKNALIKIHNDYRDKKLPQPNDEYVNKHRKDIQTEQLTKLFQFYLRVI